MTNEQQNHVEESKDEDGKEILTDELIDEYSSNDEVIKFVQSKFSRMSRVSSVRLIRIVLRNQVKIPASAFVEKPKTFVRYNLGKFEKDKYMRLDEVKALRRELNGFLLEIGKEPIEIDTKTSEFKATIVDGERCFLVDKNTMYEKARKLVCDEGVSACLRYNFTKSDMNNAVPRSVDILQHVNIQIVSIGIKFDYPLEYKYQCPQCGNRERRKSYDVVSTGDRIKCPGIYSYVGGDSEMKTRLCGLSLVPDKETSYIRDAYYYDMSYEDEEGNKLSVPSFSFNKYLPGFYECVLFRVKNPRKTEFYQIIDVKPMSSNEFKLPKRVKGENYVFILQRALDKYIKQQTDMEIFGLYPIKISLILEKVFSAVGLKLKSNIQIVGDASTGKSIVLKYYGYLLDGHLHLTTDGLSVSIPSLRGTRETISLFGKDIKIITVGFLGTYKSIHIDEAGENKELIQQLKIFLFETNYSYNKAGGTGTYRKRVAHGNISENLDYEHLGQYRGMIRKEYRENEKKIGAEQPESWSEQWDLHLPLFKYTNSYLYRAVKNVREIHKQSQKFWIDGYDYALHERFPFYFYLVNEKENIKLSQVIKGNVARNTIGENLELIRALKSEDIESFFNKLKEFKESKYDESAFDKVDYILKEYGIKADSRQKEFYYDVLKVSRIVNQRNTYDEMDYDLIRWILETTNCKIDVVDTDGYKIHGAPDLKKEKEIEEKIEKASDTEFGGLPNGEFD